MKMVRKCILNNVNMICYKKNSSNGPRFEASRKRNVRRTFCTLSRLSRAPTKQMGPYRPPGAPRTISSIRRYPEGSMRASGGRIAYRVRSW